MQRNPLIISTLLGIEAVLVKLHELKLLWLPKDSQ
jgi:hypothetical protein